MAITGFGYCVVDDTEYSRYERDRKYVNVSVKATGASLAGLSVIIQIIKAKREYDVVVAYITTTLQSDGTTSWALDLSEVLDSETEAPVFRRGYYSVRVLSAANTTIQLDSNEFLVTMITSKNLRETYLDALKNRPITTVELKSQPELITGVTVTDNSQPFQTGFYPLVYNYAINGPDIVRSISLCGGPLVILTSTKSSYIVRKGNTSDWIEIKVIFADLSIVSITEELLFTNIPLSNNRLQQYIDRAISWIEDVALHVYLEPTRLITELDTSLVSTPVGTDIPVFSNDDWDKIVNSLPYYSPSSGHTISIQFPYFPIIKLDNLNGKYGQSSVITVNTDWIQFNERNGFVELIPALNSPAFISSFGILWGNLWNRNSSIPNFWHFSGLFGFKNLPSEFLSIISKKAAIDILITLGFNRGISSTGLNRDGIGENISYSLGKFGIFSGIIQGYQDALDKELAQLRSSFIGFNYVV